jgi:hypothetical protein
MKYGRNVANLESKIDIMVLVYFLLHSSFFFQVLHVGDPLYKEANEAT